MFDRLVVGFDASEGSTAAVRWAAAEAETRHAAVRVISSYYLPPVMDFYGLGLGAGSPSDLDQLQSSCQQRLSAVVAESAAAHPTVGFDFRAVRGPAAQALLDESEQADLVVVGTKGSGDPKGFMLGSVTTVILSRSRCPIAVIPAPLAAKCGRIVAGIDGSECSELALLWAVEEAERHESELVVEHAWEYPYRLTAEGVARGSDIAQIDGALVLEQAVQTARELTAAPIVSRLVEGHAGEALIEASESADMVVVGSRGRGGFRALILGSVARALTAHAACPVVVVRDPSHS